MKKKQKKTYRRRKQADGCHMGGGLEEMNEKGEEIKKYKLAVMK